MLVIIGARRRQIRNAPASFVKKHREGQLSIDDSSLNCTVQNCTGLFLSGPRMYTGISVYVELSVANTRKNGKFGFFFSCLYPYIDLDTSRESRVGLGMYTNDWTQTHP